jgi:starch synthase
MAIEPMGIDFIVPIGSKTMTGHLHRAALPHSDVPVYLVRQDQYYDRENLYWDGSKEYVDNCERFVFFSRAVLESIRLLELDIDIIHANDWQTGLVPAYLRIEYQGIPRYSKISCLLTIHNIVYQGQFWHWDMLLTGLDWRYFNWHQMEFFGKLNLLKTGIVFSDSLSTVSPRYAQEIQTPEYGAGLQGVLQYRRDVLTGILNGIDVKVWNPQTDPHLPANYTADTVTDGKPQCKAALQRELGLPELPDVPVMGIIGRLDHQKGLDMVAEVVPDWVAKSDIQWIILGTGDQNLESRFRQLSLDHPSKVSCQLKFSADLAHRIEAGVDMFLMPSRYEPCGLNQMYSLRYGTVPIVRSTGGLADTIVDANEQTLTDGSANGFCFQEDNPRALDEAIRRAYDAFRRPEMWLRLIQTGMGQDWSWKRSAAHYVQLYEQTIKRRAQSARSL